MLIGRGTFSPGPGHVMRGTFTLTRLGGGILMETDEDFLFDGSPEPDWALYSGVPMDRLDPNVQAAAQATRFGRMPGGIVQIRGKQTGLIPPSINIDEYDTIFLWCYQIPAILGVGPIVRV